MTQSLTRMGDVVELRRRQVSVDVVETYEEIGVRSFGKGIFHKDPVSGADLGNKRVYQIHPGDLVISNVFAWEGAIAVATEDEEGKIGSHRFMTFDMDSERADASYLRYYLLSDPGLSLIRAASPGSAGRNRTLGIQAFQDIEIPLPPLERQKAVAARLGAIEGGTVRVIDQLKKAKDLTSKALGALVHRADLDDEERRTQGWQRVPMAEVVSHVDRREPLVDDRVYPLAGIYSFGKGLIDRDPIRGSDTSYKRMTPLRVGDLVMSKLNGWEGALAVVDDPFDGYYVSNEYPVFEVDTRRITTSFLAALVSTSTFWQALDDATRGSMVRRRRVHPSGLLETDIWLPPLEYQELVGEHLDVLRQVGGEERRTELLEAVMPSVLNAAFG